MVIADRDHENAVKGIRRVEEGVCTGVRFRLSLALKVGSGSECFEYGLQAISPSRVVLFGCTDNTVREPASSDTDVDD